MDLKIKDVSELLQVSENTVRRWVVDGKIPAYRLHHQYRFSRIEIENWMVHCKLKTTGSTFFEEKQIYPALQGIGTHKGGMQPFSLYRAIHKGGVFHMDGSSKEEMIALVMKEISPSLGVDAEVISELLLDREHLMSTALNCGVAVPHTRDFLLEQPFDFIAVVFPNSPIDWGALDGQLVHTLFFLFSSSDKRHLHLLAKLAHLSNREDAMTFFKQKPEKDKVLDFVKEWETNLQN